jgi:hypothetical protein
MLAVIVPGAFELVIIFFIMIITVFPFWMICAKTGFPGWISLAIFIPILNIALLFFLALAEWPALKNVHQQDQRES